MKLENIYTEAEIGGFDTTYLVSGDSGKLALKCPC